jgi:hypothetical protein
MKPGRVSTCPVCHVGFVQSQWHRVYCNRVCAQKAFAKAERAYALAGKDLAMAMVEVGS